MIPSDQPRRMDRQFYGLQYLRALAALMVLAVHAFKFDTFPFGMLGTGVDLFFVLSGFLMVAITDGKTRPRQFLLARMRRIIPLYWILTTYIVVLFWGAVSWRSPIPFWHLSAYTFDVPTSLIAASYAFVPWWNPGANMAHPVLPQGWTLNLEMMFYLLFALALYLPRKLQLPALSGGLLTLSGWGMAGVFTAPTIIGWTNPIIIEFVVGAWIGYMWQNQLKIGRYFLVMAIGIIVLVFLLYLFKAVEPKMLRFVYSIPYGALLIFVLKAEERPGTIPRHAFPLLLGNASYAIYLVQFVPIAILDMSDVSHNLAYATIVIGASVPLGLMLHYWVEKPTLRLLGQR